ncbi:MAG: hypothetical protein AB8G05_04615 [Oligoflexales bacterium]
MLKIYRIIQILLLVILATQTASCGNKKEKEEEENSIPNLDVSAGLRFSSAEVHENGEIKKINLDDMPHQGCSYYQSNGKNIFYWNFGQDEGVKLSSNIEIIKDLDGLPKSGQSWEIHGKSPKEIVMYHRFSGSEHQIWGLGDPEASCTVKIDSFNLLNTRRLVDPDDQKLKTYMILPAKEVYPVD